MVAGRLAFIGLVVSMAAIGAGGFVWYETRDAPPPTFARLGSPAPYIRLPLLDGGNADLAQQQGNVVLLNFWATWCIPYRTEMPALQGLADSLQGEHFALLTVNLQEDAATIHPFQQELGLRLPVRLDEEGDVTRRYGVRALPATFLIDQDGIVREQRLGPLAEGGADTPWSSLWIGARVRGLLGRS